MPQVSFPRPLAAPALLLALAGCSTVDFNQPEMPLPARFSEGADIRLTSFEGAAGLGSRAEGPALSLLQDQLSYGVVRCSRPGPPLELEIAADFVTRKGDGAGDHLIGVATWRDPASRQVVARHHLDVEADLDTGDRRRVNVREGADMADSSVPHGQLVAGEAFVAQACEKAFGWSGLPG